ncbi:MAG: DUF1573 domain-containing protein [Flavobacteriales bacterium]|nr:DUF1573 domain-containing protein [Flavobacteriales bacterium]MCB9335142.1 DUF1573 domain-containing protein [Flavobacteriales bacterium]
MKKVLLSFSLVVCSVLGMQISANAQELKTDAPVAIENPNAPVMEFETEVIDYGTIEQGADGVREFKFTNTGKEPLIISNARGSCGCTVPTWPKEPIKPGESSVIKVKYDTKRLGAINKSVTITSNASEATKVIRIKGNIIAPKTTPVKETSVGAPVEN